MRDRIWCSRIRTAPRILVTHIVARLKVSLNTLDRRIISSRLRIFWKGNIKFEQSVSGDIPDNSPCTCYIFVYQELFLSTCSPGTGRHIPKKITKDCESDARSSMSPQNMHINIVVSVRTAVIGWALLPILRQIAHQWIARRRVSLVWCCIESRALGIHTLGETEIKIWWCSCRSGDA